MTVELGEGQRLEEWAETVERADAGFTGAQLLEAARRPVSGLDVLRDKPSGASLLGYLLPQTYRLARGPTGADDLIRQMLQRFGEVVTPDLRARASAAGLNTHQLVTLASIVQRVAPSEADRLPVATLLLGRLRARECLCVDPPLQYLLGKPGDWWPALPGPGRAVLPESPYNTYTHHGLPPGPICNPSASALRAVV